MLEKLFRLGFTDAICTDSIDKTAEVMETEFYNNPDLADAVLAELQEESNPYPVTKANYEVKLRDWIQHHANGIHAEQARAILAPFRLMASLFFD